MTLSDSRGHQSAATLHRLTRRPDVVVQIQRTGVLARRFCERVAFAKVEAIFERCFYLRSGDDFICVGEPDIGNGPITLIGNLPTLPALKGLAGQIALISEKRIAIGNTVRFALDHSELWRPSGWPACLSPDHLNDICAALASRTAAVAPPEGLARCISDENEAPAGLLTRVARPRIMMFERWLSGILDAGHAPAVSARESVKGLIGLGPGLTPSGDDFLVGALSALGALGQSEAHAAVARAVVDVLPGLTTPLSACFLRSAAAGHVGENLHQIISLIMTGNIDAAVTAAGKIGHSSGWDMMAGVVTALRIAAAHLGNYRPARGDDRAT